MNIFIKSAAQRGVGMIELLVAVFILSIGLLGMAGLQAVSLKNNNDSLNRSYATFLSSSIIDRIRANPTGSYATDFSDAPPVKADSCEGSSSNCNNAQLAQYDLATWKCSLGGHNDDSNCTGEPAGLLNSGQGNITVTGTEYTITIRWTERLDAEGSPVITSFVTRTQL
ncbi:type IV pilus modification protein PilV [Zooshikella sp. RANM57]|uniref:type IV pilus modification protein PilV n=1 Tax=Zooshikella sp. RANM57 TaxID=3425863 RepID=UPI003D6DE7EC